jgi:hypothetical protein
VPFANAIIPFGKTSQHAAGFDDFSGKVSSQNRRKLNGLARFRRSAAYFPVNGIDTCGVHLTSTSLSPYFAIPVSSYRYCDGSQYA